MEMKSFLIIGMGSFGHHLCRSLAENECEIMVVDKDSEAVEDVLPLGVSGRVGDCTNMMCSALSALTCSTPALSAWVQTSKTVCRSQAS